MSVWPDSSNALLGREGELVSVRVSTEPRLLEHLLDCLARLSFPINPQIFHGLPTIVEFPAFEQRLGEVRNAVRGAGFPSGSVSVAGMLQAISARA